ncbi:hypothetical protein L596_028522 [Steinernema carpocapsae]|uniref:Uncharacterized protein n=1 Tax=Steinernema carpocapsae TaxID=34508 RepID=A0A4U5LZM2_STECR|nr:hypothetical protein L596_028522 [Steinernema carpocapsae]
MSSPISDEPTTTLRGAPLSKNLNSTVSLSFLASAGSCTTCSSSFACRTLKISLQRHNRTKTDNSGAAKSVRFERDFEYMVHVNGGKNNDRQADSSEKPVNTS